MSEKEMRYRIIELLPKTSLFGGLAREDIDFFIESLVEKNYSAGEKVFEEGGKPGDSYLLLEGEVEITMAGIVAAKFEPGMIFGIASPIGVQKQIVTATAHTDITLAVIPKMTLYLLEEQRPKLFGKIILNEARDLARHLKTMKDIVLSYKEKVDL